MRTNVIHKINSFVQWYFSNAEHVKFLTICRKWSRNIVDFAMKWSCFSNYPLFLFHPTSNYSEPGYIEHLRTLNTFSFPVSVQCRQVPRYFTFLIHKVFLSAPFVYITNLAAKMMILIRVYFCAALLVPKTCWSRLSIKVIEMPLGGKNVDGNGLLLGIYDQKQISVSTCQLKKSKEIQFL